MTTRFPLLIIGLLCLLAAGCSTTQAPPEKSDLTSPARITVLYDAFGKSSAMKKDWGYAALIEYQGKRILFDTGNDAEVLEQNAKASGVDLSRLDFVVMSHRHGDHMGGMSYLLRVNPKVVIYAPKEGFGVYGADLPSSFYRKDDTLPREQRYFGGTPPEVMRFGSAWPEAHFTLIERDTEIAPGIHLIALVSDKPGTLELRELSLAIETPAGMVLVVGCAHPGIDRIVAAAARIDTRILLVAGGLHLVVAPDPEIERIVRALHDSYQVGFIAPGHCTGEATFTALLRAFGDRNIYAGLGTRIAFGDLPHRSKMNARLDVTELLSYRKLLREHDEEHRHLAQRN
ncbi:MAG TPA: MBL fold metallo-hydrolase [Methylophilaceae bacterium]|nr:MBL fold metallo-hydrolase [Methylophilaceae bacterium]